MFRTLAIFGFCFVATTTTTRTYQGQPAVVSGHVVDETGRSVAAAVVTLEHSQGGTVRTLTSPTGIFRFADVPPGDVSLIAKKAGYSDGAYGRVSVGGPGRVLRVGSATKPSDIEMSIWKYGVVAGRVTDEAGEPAVKAAVQIFRRISVGPQERFERVESVTTDDLGRYRTPVEAGVYAVAVPVTRGSSLAAARLAVDPTAVARIGDDPRHEITINRGVDVNFSLDVTPTKMAIAVNSGSQLAVVGTTADGHPLVFSTRFFGGVDSLDGAQLVKLAPGGEYTAADIRLSSVRAVRLAGKLSGPISQVGGIALELLPVGVALTAPPIRSATTVSQPDGRFEFQIVAPGSYQLRGMRSMIPPLSAEQSAEVKVFVVGMMQGSAAPLSPERAWKVDERIVIGDSDLPDVTVAVKPAIRVTGRVGIEPEDTNEQRAQLGRTVVAIEPTQGSVGPIRRSLDATGIFVGEVVFEGTYRITAERLPPGWFISGVSVRGQDASDELRIGPFDLSDVLVSLTRRPNAVRGTIFDRSGRPDPQATAVAYSIETRSDRTPKVLRYVRADETGRFEFLALPVGRFYLAAMPSAVDPDWLDREFAASLEPVRVQIDVGKTTSELRDLRTAAVRQRKGALFTQPSGSWSPR